SSTVALGFAFGFTVFRSHASNFFSRWQSPPMAGIELMPGIRLRIGNPTELYPVSIEMIRHAPLSRQKKLASCPGGPAGIPKESRNVVKYGLPFAYIS